MSVPASAPRRGLLRGIAASMALPGAALAAAGDPPAAPSARMIVPFPAGGSTDEVARLLAPAWAVVQQQAIRIEQHAGEFGARGMEAAAHAASDGETVLLNSLPLATARALNPRQIVDPQRDFDPVGMVAVSQHVLLTHPGVPANTVGELIALAGEGTVRLSDASAGPGTNFHLAAELFKAMAWIQMVHVPYRGGLPALLETAGGKVDLAFVPVGAAVPYVRSGALRALGTTGALPSPLLPGVPTIARSGLSDYSFESWYMVLAPVGVPSATLARLSRTLSASLRVPALVEAMAARGYRAWASQATQAAAFLAQETANWTRITKDRRITAE